MNILTLFLTFVGVIAVLAFAYALWLRMQYNECLVDKFVTSTKRLDGVYAIVTGSNQGIGYETALGLAIRGARVILACRSEIKARSAVKKITVELANIGEVHGSAEFVASFDGSKLASIKSFVKEYLKREYPLHLLVNNAGMGAGKFKQTADGFEMCFQINYVSHFLLTHLLLPLMVKSAISAKNNADDGGLELARIVNIASCEHEIGDLDTALITDMKEMKKLFRTRRSYGNSKLAQIMHATYLQEKIFTPQKLPVVAFSLHPGFVNSNIFKWERQPIYIRAVVGLLYPALLFATKTLEAGAQNSLHCCIDDLKHGELEPGKYHTCNQVSKTYDEKRQSTDEEYIEKLYKWTLEQIDREENDYDVVLKEV